MKVQLVTPEIFKIVKPEFKLVNSRTLQVKLVDIKTEEVIDCQEYTRNHDIDHYFLAKKSDEFYNDLLESGVI